MANGLDLGNVLLQAEQIKGARQKFDANQLLRDRALQFNPLAQNILTDPNQQNIAAGFAVDPEGTQAALATAKAGQDIERQQFQMDQLEADQTVAAARSVFNSPNPAALMRKGFPGFAEQLREQGIDPDEVTDEQAKQMAAALIEEFSPFTSGVLEATAGQREFASRVAGANIGAAETERANRIALGLEPRATGAAQKIFMIGDVPHIFDPNSGEAVPVNVRGKDITTRDVAESEAEVLATRERAKGDAVLANKTISSGFSTIDNIRRNVITLNRAKQELEGGAKTGAVARFFPSFRAATLRLENTQKQLGLDVIGAVTFGALSKGELDVAMSKALPTGLKSPELIIWLDEKIAAQTKLADYYDEQINFLSEGKTVNEWRQLKRQEAGQAALPSVDAVPEGFVVDQ